MSYREENDQVILTMSREDYDRMLIWFGAMTHLVIKFDEDASSLVRFLNRLNSGNPHYTPYQVKP